MAASPKDVQDFIAQNEEWTWSRLARAAKLSPSTLTPATQSRWDPRWSTLDACLDVIRRHKAAVPIVPGSIAIEIPNTVLKDRESKLKSAWDVWSERDGVWDSRAKQALATARVLDNASVVSIDV